MLQLESLSKALKGFVLALQARKGLNTALKGLHEVSRSVITAKPHRCFDKARKS